MLLTRKYSLQAKERRYRPEHKQNCAPRVRNVAPKIILYVDQSFDSVLKALGSNTVGSDNTALAHFCNNYTRARTGFARLPSEVAFKTLDVFDAEVDRP